MLEAGAGKADITPAVGTPLSGFISRENRPSTGIDTPLYVRALALRAQGQTYFLLSYELLGLNDEIEQQITAALAADLGPLYAPERCLLTAVHTHSGPPTGLLIGESGPDPAYVDLLKTQSTAAAHQALDALQPARLYTTVRHLPGLTYNRRALLDDGRVSISPVPDRPVVRRGPLDDSLTILLFRDLAGKPLAAVAHFACHGVAVASQHIGADIPGLLAGEIGARLQAPCLFLQSAAGDVNPTTVTAGFTELRDWIRKACTHLDNLEEDLKPAPTLPLMAVEHPFTLEFAPLPPVKVAQRQVDHLKRIAGGDTQSADLQETLRAFKNTMNIPQDAPLDAAKSRHVAQALAGHASRVVEAARKGATPPGLPLRLCAWRIGRLALVFIAGEVFTSTGLKIRGLSERLTVLPVSCASPLVGYLPDQEAVFQGGYEVDDAWRFYGYPAPFAFNSEARLVMAVVGLIRELSQTGI